MKTGVSKTSNKSTKSKINNKPRSNSNSYAYNGKATYNSCGRKGKQNYTKATDNIKKVANNKPKTTPKRAKSTSKKENDDMLPLFQKVVLVNSSKEKKVCMLGFSWSNLLLPFITPLFRKDYVNLMVQITLCAILKEISSFLMAIIWVIYCAFYNEIYIKGLIKRGYKPSTKLDRKILKDEDIV